MVGEECCRIEDGVDQSNSGGRILVRNVVADLSEPGQGVPGPANSDGHSTIPGCEMSSRVVLIEEVSGLAVSDAEVNVPEEIEFVNDGLVGRDVNQHDSGAATLGEHDGPAGLADLLDDAGGVCTEVGDGLDVRLEVHRSLGHRYT